MDYLQQKSLGQKKIQAGQLDKKRTSILRMLLETLRDINCNILINNSLEPSIIFNGSIILLTKKSKIFDEDRQVILITYNILYDNKVYIVNGKQFLNNEYFKKDTIVIEDDWQKRFYIENFEDPNYYSWENTFLSIQKVLHTCINIIILL